MATFFDHRAADIIRSETAKTRQNQPRYLEVAEKADPCRTAEPIAWIEGRELPLREAVPALIGFANIASPTNERTLQLSILPRPAFGTSFPLLDRKHVA